MDPMEDKTKISSPDPPHSVFLPLDEPENAVMKSFQGPFVEKLQDHESLVGKKLDVKSSHLTPGQIMISDDQFLTYSIGKLGFKDGVAIEAENIHNHNCTVEPNRILSSEKQCANFLRTHLPPSPYSYGTPNKMNVTILPSNSRVHFNLDMNGVDNSNFLKLDGQQKAGSSETLALQMNPPQVLSSVHGPGVQISVLPHPHMHPQRMSQAQPQAPWLHMDEKLYLGMHLNSLQLQQLENQLSEAQYPIQAGGNMTSRLETQNMEPSYIGVPFSCQFEHLNKESFQSNYEISRGSNSLGSTFMGSTLCSYNSQGGESCSFEHVQRKMSPSYLAHLRSTISVKESSPIHEFGAGRKQNTSQKVLSRNSFWNEFKSVEFSSCGESKSLEDSNLYRNMFPNNHLHINAPDPHASSFLLSGCNFRDISPNIKNDKHKLQLRSQKYNLVDEVSSNLHSMTKKYNSVDEDSGDIYSMSKDQYGCRFLQNKLTEGTAEDLNKIFLEIIGHSVELMVHPFGNYLVQKLLEVCDNNQRTQIVYAITAQTGDLIRISCNIHGTRAVQKVIETIKYPEQCLMVVSSLKPGIVKLIEDANGNHVAKHCLLHLMPVYSEFLFDSIAAHCVEVATDCHGCCVLKECLIHLGSELRCHLILEITTNALILSQDPFGNYIIQSVLELEISWATAEVLNQLEGSYGYLAKQKYSSHVVESCLKYAGERRFPFIIQELIDDPHLDQIMQDPYGNYVIQTALKNSKGCLRAALTKAIRLHTPALRSNPYGKKFLGSNGLKTS